MLNLTASNKKIFTVRLLSLAVSMCLSPMVFSADPDVVSAASLEEGFANPPNSARPRVWWHWLNGNVSIDGIDKDLEWMHRIGLGGVHQFDASLPTPQVVNQRLIYMDPGWKKAFRHAVDKADKYGMEFAIATSPGWSATGGPWVAPQDGMKKIVWSEMVVEGGKTITARLPAPPTATGTFQTLAADHPAAESTHGANLQQAHGEIAVFAVPQRVKPLTPVKNVVINNQQVNAQALSDNDLNTSLDLSIINNSLSMFIDYPAPVTIRSARLFIKDSKFPFGPQRFNVRLEVQENEKWRAIKDFPLADASTTIGFDPITAQHFRLVITQEPEFSTATLLGSMPGAELAEIFAAKNRDKVSVAEFKLFAESQVTEVEAKAGFTTAANYYDIANNFSAQAPSLDQVVDITQAISPEGKISWVPPAGSWWKIIRLGWSLTGKTNHPATPEATGLEVDKYDAQAVRRYLTTYLSMHRAIVGKEKMGNHGITALLSDSVEIGASNWTPALLQEFKQRRGYDATPWMPVISGVVINSPAESDKFLFDFRQTLAELIADAHYKTVASVAHENGLKVYGEALEDQRPVLGDDIAMRRWADVPMAALWAWPGTGKPRPNLIGDIRGAASASHFYGQNIVSAESMTSAYYPWAFSPADLKHVIDLEFALGVNRPAVHTSVHQPVDDKLPGLSLFIFGQHFNRHESWAEMARPWVDYMARSSFMLQQGRNAADIAIFYGEDAPVTTQFSQGIPAGLPKHYAFDFVNAEMLSQLRVDKDHLLTSPGGANYKVIVLNERSKQMSVATLKQLQRLVNEGAIVIGNKPLYSVSLSDDQTRFRDLITDIWSKPTVFPSENIEKTMMDLGIAYNVDAQDDVFEKEKLLFIHRKLEQGDIWYFNNRLAKDVHYALSLRTTGMIPEVWDPVDGTIRPVSYQMKNNRTVVSLDFKSEESLFVVFRHPGTASDNTVSASKIKNIIAVNGLWKLKFEKGLSLPDTVTLQNLQPLEQSTDQQIRYFSGTMLYSTTFRKPLTLNSQQTIFLDLGQVGDVAQVFINDQEIATHWYAPKQIEINQNLLREMNKLEVRVANLWVNRLIGDKQKGIKPLAWTAGPTFNPTAPLRASGLIGPVKLVIKE